MKKAIAFIIIGALFMVWGVDQYGIYKKSFISKDAVVLSKPEVKEENDNKYVFTSGKLVVDKAPVDPLSGVSANALALVRKVEMYQYYIDGDTVYKGLFERQMPNIKGDGGEEYINPAFPENLNSAVIFGKVSIDGEFPVGEEYINVLLNKNYSGLSVERQLTDITDIPKFKNDYGIFRTPDGYYATGETEEWQIGDLKISYSCLPAENLPVYYILGLQNDGVLGGTGANIGACMSDIPNSTVKQTAYTLYGSSELSMYLIAVSGFLFISAGIIIIVINKRKNGGNAS